MAAKTPSNIYVHSMGDCKLIRAVFTDIDDTDTWTSNLVGIVDQWFNATSNPATQTDTGCNVSQASGVFTFYPGADNAAGTLFVMLRG